MWKSRDSAFRICMTLGVPMTQAIVIAAQSQKWRQKWKLHLCSLKPKFVKTQSLKVWTLPDFFFFNFVPNSDYEYDCNDQDGYDHHHQQLLGEPLKKMGKVGLLDQIGGGGFFRPFSLEKYFLELSNHLLQTIMGRHKECQQLARKPFQWWWWWLWWLL